MIELTNKEWKEADDRTRAQKDTSSYENFRPHPLDMRDWVWTGFHWEPEDYEDCSDA